MTSEEEGAKESFTADDFDGEVRPEDGGCKSGEMGTAAVGQAAKAKVTPPRKTPNSCSSCYCRKTWKGAGKCLGKL